MTESGISCAEKVIGISDLTAKLYSYQNLCIVCYTEMFRESKLYFLGVNIVQGNLN